MNEAINHSLGQVARFYDQRKVGHVGPLGFRRSTDLLTFLPCLDRLVAEGLIHPGQTRFLDLGCADGRVNVLLSYLVSVSVGIEIDDWTLDEYAPLREELDAELGRNGCLLPPENIHLFHGDSMDDKVHEKIAVDTGVKFSEFDLFYTYLIMHEEFAHLIEEKGRKGAVFLVYGLDRIMPRYEELVLLDALSPLEGILGVYQKR